MVTLKISGDAGCGVAVVAVDSHTFNHGADMADSLASAPAASATPTSDACA